ncbi:molecular chaperone SurA [Lysobacter arseniciresistens ZS79]|uniref:Chaperone SurA n=1 Tax=Lysobacter arseniciresistens ZS79 TaxID=913325 RepID=A0A0A0F261_9GAMM|nr:peptidylprolyl isomerase [Lysobacter arseniciresistens]KGM56655.1 molecular chaperone SurA [Lysobacter arseniciresistens ZS79]
MKKFFACVLAATLLSATVQAQQVQPIDGIAVVVDEGVILQSELDRAVANIRAQYAGRADQLPPPDVLERQVAERLVLLKLQVARAEATGVRVSDQEVDQAIAAIAAQNRVSVEQLRAQLAADGSSFEQFRDSIRDELLVQRLRQRFAQTQVSVSDAEVDAALESQQATGEQYHLAHILVALPEGATPEQIATGEQKILGIRGLLERGEMDFAAAAVRYSDSPNALEGGDLGWRGASEIPAAFAALVRQMSPGQVTDPIRGPSGFQLLQLVDTRAAGQGGPSMVTQLRASHILVRVDDTISAEQAKAEADTLHARIVGGADFAELAREHSDDPSSQASGGDLGWFTRDQFGPDFGAQVAALADGGVSAPFRTQAGWHIVKRTGTREADVGDENERAQARETIGRRKLEEEWNRFLREMRGEAFVDFRTGAAAEAQAADAAPAETPASGD